MDLSGALIGLDSYFKAGDERKVREYNQALRDAELSVLPDQTEARRLGFRDQAGAADARMTLRPGQTANEQAKIGLESADLASQAKTQPQELDTRERGVATENNTAKVKEALSGLAVERIPETLAQARTNGLIDDAQLGNLALSTLAGLIKRGDPEQVLKFMKGMDASAPDGKKKGIESVGVITDPKTGGRVFAVKDANGNVVLTLSPEQLQAIEEADMKPETKVVNPGDSVVRIGPRGATPLYTAPETPGSLATRQGPLQRDVGYLMQSHGMTKEQALSYLNSSKTRTREQFIQDGLSNKMRSGMRVTEQDASDLGRLYDSIPRDQSAVGLGSTQSTPSNTAPANTIGPLSPNVRSFLGIR